MLCRQGGPGRVKLMKSFDVYIDKTELDFLLRWYKKPREMAKHLLKLLVGENNLKNMVAIGRKTKICQREPVPKDIFRSVESKYYKQSFSIFNVKLMLFINIYEFNFYFSVYVNKKCCYKLSPQEYVTCINLMITTLRHPKPIMPNM